MAEGKFITFEGGEGAGKSTQAELLRKNLAAMGVQGVAHPRARRLAARRGDPRRAAVGQGEALRADGRGAAVLRRARFASGTHHPPGAGARHLGDLRPLLRFDPRLSGRGGRRVDFRDERAGAHRRRRDQAGPDADSRSAAGGRAEARRRPGRRRRPGHGPLRGDVAHIPSAICARNFWRSPRRSRGAAPSSTPAARRTRWPRTSGR